MQRPGHRSHIEKKKLPIDGQAAEGVIMHKIGAAILNFFDLNDDIP
jgi:hypothetical protein